MLYTPVHRSRVSESRRDALATAVILAAALIALTLGAVLFHFATQPHPPSMFPPAEWALTPPNWVD